jgi:thiol-disulfide isomerase/thioredoxin
MAMGSTKPVKVTFHIKDCEQHTIPFNIAGTTKQVKLDEKGNATFQLNISGSQYATSGKLKFFLEPGKNLDISFSAAEEWPKVQFGGTGAPENNYLNSTDLHMLRGKLLGPASKGKLSLEKAVEDFLHDRTMRTLSPAFRKMEAAKFRFNYMYLCQGNKTRKIDEQELRDILVEDTAFLGTFEYQGFLEAANEIFGEGMPAVDLAIAPVLCAVKHFRAQQILDFLIDKHAQNYIEMQRIDNTEELVALYDKYVKNEEKKAAFHKSLENYAGARKGNVCVNFSYPDVNGKKESLADFKGKYVLLDFWASWCGPCASDVPFLHKLEEQYSRNNIVFIGISVDEGESHIANWKKRVIQLSGIQLLATDKKLTDQFVIHSIPKYVLLDTAGRVINSYMPRPYDPEMARILEALPGF